MIQYGSHVCFLETSNSYKIVNFHAILMINGLKWSAQWYLWHCIIILLFINVLRGFPFSRSPKGHPKFKYIFFILKTIYTLLKCCIIWDLKINTFKVIEQVRLFLAMKCFINHRSVTPHSPICVVHVWTQHILTET